VALFFINEEQIRQSLKSANKDLVTHCGAVSYGVDCRMPNSIETTIEIHIANDLILELQAAQKQTRDARLSDQRPFRNAIKIIDDFYKEIDNALETQADGLLAMVAEALIEQEEQNFIQTALREGNGEQVGQHQALIAFDSSANAIATASPSNIRSASAARLEWAVKDIDENTLDLEAIRHHFTKTELKKACERLLKEEGPIEIEGLEYERKAVMP